MMVIMPWLADLAHRGATAILCAAWLAGVWLAARSEAVSAPRADQDSERTSLTPALPKVPVLALHPATLLALPRFCAAMADSTAGAGAGRSWIYEIERVRSGMRIFVYPRGGLIAGTFLVPIRYRGHEQFDDDPVLFALTTMLSNLPGVCSLVGIDPTGRPFHTLGPLDLPRGTTPEQRLERAYEIVVEIAGRYRPDGSYDRPSG
ncbi:hypothetical protein [Arenibaculum pallidiluteum]|uniref:hypothetical protein n=1 Tax=Arenibaculum pallidiluteum TaxID=2812559 RepID=UPI001A95F10D|nr:hypothetical protein [Arenibaculum pallidiluteum]